MQNHCELRCPPRQEDDDDDDRDGFDDSVPSAAALSADPGEQAMGIMVYRLIVVSYFILLPSYFWYRWCARAAAPPAPGPQATLHAACE